MTFDHIRQYAGPADDTLAAQLYATLERMKSRCDYPPLDAPNLTLGLDTDELEAYRDPWSKGYFIPTGLLGPGHYRIEARFEGGGRVRIELIDRDFDPLIDECLTPESPSLTLELTLAAHWRGYLRIRASSGQSVRQLRFRLDD